jgi:hypothetical protein
VAHLLAKLSFDSKETLVWKGDPLDFILPSLIADVTMLSSN